MVIGRVSEAVVQPLLSQQGWAVDPNVERRALEPANRLERGKEKLGQTQAWAALQQESRTLRDLLVAIFASCRKGRSCGLLAAVYIIFYVWCLPDQNGLD